MYAAAVTAKPRSWNAIADPFLRAIEQFDAKLINGEADMGDLQNGKGDWFNDLLALILEGCAEVELYSRQGVPGFTMPTHSLDITHPSVGTAKFVVEAKMLGTPKHPWSQKQKPLGRPGSADIKKRVAELSFKTIDLKAEHSRIATEAGDRPTVNVGGNLRSWLRAAQPKSYLFIAARVISDTDLAAVIRYADRAAQVVDGVGICCYRLSSDASPTLYEVVTGVPDHLQIDKTLYGACEDLVAMSREPVTELPKEVVEDATRDEALRKAAEEEADE
jgi:hypothetical protein